MNAIKTFVISSDNGLDFRELRKILDISGYHELTINDANNADYIGFIFQSQIYNAEGKLYRNETLMYKQCNLINNLSGKIAIDNKRHLYRNLPNNKFMADTCDIKELRNIKPGEVYIIKPIGSSSGIGNEIVSNNAELARAKTNIAKDFKYGAIASKYIQNPMLFEERKFHVRMYGIFAIINDSFISSLFPRGKIITASAKYKNAEFQNKAIHDSHNDSTPRNIYFPAELPNGANYVSIFAQMQNIFDAVSQMFSKHAGKFAEAANAFDIVGIDFMITADSRVILIEINGRDVGINSREGINAKYSEFSREIFEWMYNIVIEKAFI